MQTEFTPGRNQRRLPICWEANVCFHPSIVCSDAAHAHLRPIPTSGGLPVLFYLLVVTLVTLVLCTTGCSAPAVRQQRLVAKPNMTFSDSAAFKYDSPRLLGQLATGLASAGGPQNSGCTSCR